MKNNPLPYIVIGALIVVILILGIKACNKTPDTIVHTDTTYVHDTTHIPQAIVYDTIHTPPVIVHIPSDNPPIYSPDPDFDAIYKAYNDMSDSLYSTNIQSDKIYLRDSLGKRVGTVNILDSVKANRIASRSVNYMLSFPVITNTVTVTNKVIEHKNSFYIGGGLQGNRTDIINGVNAGLAWQNKRGGILIVGTAYDMNNKINLQVQKYWTIGKKK